MCNKSNQADRILRNNMNDILKKLKIPNNSQLLEFIIFYSRMEYALKRSNYKKKKGDRIEILWGNFISNNKNNFDHCRTSDLKKATNFLLEFPAKQQYINDKNELDFKDHDATRKGNVLLRLFHCIRIIRNNLFHGGKFPGKNIDELSRNNELICNSIIVLKEFSTLEPIVKQYLALYGIQWVIKFQISRYEINHANEIFNISVSSSPFLC